ncbi:MAG: sodium:alanine symporter family protein [Holosporales bacterium]|jgi:AGCS family alanine or glycine:cation symporter|nr:sodium:alanine symporter family protein [Holosporales bacterium]
MQVIENIIIFINEILWGWPLIGFILITGFYFSCRLGVLGFSKLKLAMKYVFEKDGGEGDVSVFASLCTALSATVGTGNIVGIAVAVTCGGPGVIFWLWLSSIVSFAIKYAEGVLAIKYRVCGRDGNMCGGPMYYISIGLHSKPYSKFLANTFAVCGILVALIGIGTLAQSNSISVALESFGSPRIVATIFIFASVAAVVLGGLQRIAAVSEKIVPLMTLLYIGASVIVLAMNFMAIPDVFMAIFKGAFSPEAILGSGCGITVSKLASIGVSRGIFSHESGLGSSAIASATAQTTSPVKQGLVSMAGAMLSVVVCTMTGLVLILSCNNTGLFTDSCQLEGAQLTSQSFYSGLSFVSIGRYIVDLGIILFAFTTIIGWNYYGEKCTQFVFGDKYVMPYKILFLFFVVLGPFYKIDIVFTLADIATGLMAIPNLIGLVGLRKIVISETKAFWNDLKLKR